MSSDQEFSVFDCNLLRMATGTACTNLRELLQAVRTADQSVLEHHMMRCALEDHFELYEFPNDLARWCWDGLGAHAMCEELALVDPYRYESVDDLREALVAVIEGHVWDEQHSLHCRPGLELHLVSSRLFAYDTGERFRSPAALADAIGHMSTRSLYYHMHEARRRMGQQSDDFSLWLENYGAEPKLVEDIRNIDFYFLNLNQLREELLRAFHEYLPEPAVTLQVHA